MQDYLFRIGVPSKIVLDVGTNFISEKFGIFYLGYSMWFHHHITHQSNGQPAACITFVKRTMKKCYETNTYIYMCVCMCVFVLVFITDKIDPKSALGYQAWPHSCLIGHQEAYCQVSRPSIKCDNGKSNYSALINRQPIGSQDVDS